MNAVLLPESVLSYLEGPKTLKELVCPFSGHIRKLVNNVTLQIKAEEDLTIFNSVLGLQFFVRNLFCKCL